MSDGTKIEWTDATWNIINGCSVVSPGCTNCYAMRLAGTRLRGHHSRVGLTKPSKAGPVWTGETRFNHTVLLDPLKWTRPRRIFVCAHGDLFHESVPDIWIDNVFAVMALAPRHQFQVLTKRSGRMREYFRGMAWGGRVLQRMKSINPDHIPGQGALLETKNGSLPNVWLGVSVEDQPRANERIPDLLSTPAAVRWISAEPLLGLVDLKRISTMRWRGAERLDATLGTLEGEFGDHCSTRLPVIDWVVAGGESGPGARKMDPDWARRLRDDCEMSFVKFHFKQWGNFNEAGREVGKRAAGRRLDGQLHDEFPK